MFNKFALLVIHYINSSYRLEIIRVRAVEAKIARVKIKEIVIKNYIFNRLLKSNNNYDK